MKPITLQGKPRWFVWLYFRIWKLAALTRYTLTGDCGLACGYESFVRLPDRVRENIFVPEADCPVHDREAGGMKYTKDKNKSDVRMAEFEHAILSLDEYSKATTAEVHTVLSKMLYRGIDMSRRNRLIDKEIETDATAP
jgi:hypothetical protein